MTCASLTSPPRSFPAHQRSCRPFATTASTAAAIAAPPAQATSLFGARLSEKRQVQLHSPWLKWLPKALAILADRGFRNCQRFYGNFNRCVVPVARRSECGCCFRVVGHCACQHLLRPAGRVWVVPTCQAYYSSSNKVGYLAPAGRRRGGSQFSSSTAPLAGGGHI